MRASIAALLGLSFTFGCQHAREVEDGPDAQAPAELAKDPIAELASRARVSAVVDRGEKVTLAEPIAFVPSSQPARMRRATDGIHPEFAKLPEGALARRADVTLPESAAAALVVRDGDIAFSVRRLGARAGRVVASATGIRYDDAVAGGTLYTIPLYEGVEDFVSFPSKPAKSELRYALDMKDAAGLRLVDGVLEVLDAKGDPRLRVPPPRGVAPQ
jgi:hypothetical protein